MVPLLFVNILLLNLVLLGDMANLSKLCNCSPPNFDGYSNNSLLYIVGFPFHKKSFNYHIVILFYVFSGRVFGRDRRISVIMLGSRLLITESFPLIVRFLRFHFLSTFFTFTKLQCVLIMFYKSLALNPMPKSTNTFVNSVVSFPSFSSCCPLSHQAVLFWIFRYLYF